MSLIGALDAGQSALAAAQAGLQVTGNNIANAGNADYSRQVAETAPSTDQQISPGIFLGTGVDLTTIQRQVDDALNSRLRGAMSDNAAANTNQQWLTQVQSTLNALSGQDMSSQMTKFFNDWSSLANNPTDDGQRQVVLQDGANLAGYTQGLQGQLGALQTSVNQELKGQAQAANGLADQIATLNRQIVVTEGGSSGQANGLRDQRDAVLKQLSQLMNTTSIEQPDGEINVYVGSELLVNGQTNNGVSLKSKTDLSTGVTTPTLVFTANNGDIPVTSGELGALINSRSQIVDVSDQIDTLTHNLISAVNQLHASGQGTTGYDTVTSSNVVADPTAALDQPAAGLSFTPVNGSFVVHVKQNSTGLVTSTLVNVDLQGQPSDTTLNSLQAQLSGIPGVTASINGGKLTIASASPDQQISFSQDSSGTLAALGINTFFTGMNAENIGVNAQLTADPSLLAAAQNGAVGDNQVALAISQLGSSPLTSLNGQTLQQSYQALVNQVATGTAASKQNATAAQAVQDTLQNQQSSLSGVSMDEEAVNLMQQQRAFQAAAQVVTTVNTMMQTLLQMVA
jgi:flagellar hook-associated protein 1 FlgK